MGFFNGKDVPENGFTIEQLEADAQRIRTILRALMAEFVDEEDNEKLTKSEITAATRTPLACLEESAALCDAAPDLQAPPGAAEKLRLIKAANTIFRPVYKDAERLARLMRESVWRKNLFAVALARTVQNLAGILVETGSAKWLRPHVDQLKRLAGRPWRRKSKRS